jgi:radical SAM superfamily enzyme YgiQ (UPF0313 family)
MKILLAYISGMADCRDPYISLLPTGVCSLHACLRDAGFDSILANFSGWGSAEIKRYIAELKPDVVGISQWTHNRHASMELAGLIRGLIPDSIIIMGGAHATFSHSAILRNGSPVDCVVLGEGEDTLLDVARHCQQNVNWRDVPGIAYCCDGEVMVNAARPPLKNLDQLPMAARFLEYSVGVDIQLQAEFIITTRGCPSACSFCSSPKFWERKVRFRSPEQIVGEIQYIRDRFGLIYFSLRDDTFTVDRARTIEFCRVLIERRLHVVWNCQSRVSTLDEELLVWMKRAGCECIQLGVESGSPRILSQLGKSITPSQVEHAAGLIRNVGINLSIYLITDVPGETEDDLRQTIELVRRIRPDDGYVSPLAYFPGTRLFEEAIANGIVERNVFEKNREAAVYAVEKRGNSARRLLKFLGSGTAGHVERFREQKQLLGYCYATNVLAGEYFRQSGDCGAAEREFREIVEQEPDNPWGWYLLAELYAEVGRLARAKECYQAVLRINPEHGPTQQALRTKKKRDHNGPASN